MARFAAIIEGILSLRLSDTPLKAAQIERIIPSAALLTGIVTHNFNQKENHYAIASAWCFFFVSSIATCSRSNLPLQSKAKESLSLAEQAIEDALVSL